MEEESKTRVSRQNFIFLVVGILIIAVVIVLIAKYMYNVDIVQSISEFAMARPKTIIFR